MAAADIQTQLGLMWRRLDQRIRDIFREEIRKELGPNIVGGQVNGATITGTVNPAALPIATTGAVGAVEVGTGLAVSGGGVLSERAFGVAAVSSNHTMTTAEDFVKADATSGAITVTLPASTVYGRVYRVAKVDGSAHAVTIAATTGSVFGTASLTTQYQVGTYLCDGAGWYAC